MSQQSTTSTRLDDEIRRRLTVQFPESTYSEAIGELLDYYEHNQDQEQETGAEAI